MNLIARFGDALCETRLVRFTLYSLTFVDEIVSTVPVLAIPLLRTEWALDYRQVGLLLTIGSLAGWLVDPVINAMSDHWPKRPIILFSIMGMVIAQAMAGSSPNFTVILFAFLLMGITNGPILGMGQAFLIDGNLGESLRTMTRWTMMAALGDLIGPALIAAAFALSMGWRSLFWGSALLWLVAFVALAIQRLPETINVSNGNISDSSALEDDDQENETEGFNWRVLAQSLMLAIHTPSLIRWLILVMVPSFLDEMFLAFAALFLQERLGMSPMTISVAIGVHVTGGLMGLVALDRYGQRFAPQRLLGWLALIVLAGLLLFVLSPVSWLAIAALWIIGVGVSGWYPISAAEAYRTLPGRSGMVRALHSITTPMEIAVPLLIGVAAERWGIQTGVALIMLAPVAVLLLRPPSKQSG
jgi:MFS family permease